MLSCVVYGLLTFLVCNLLPIAFAGEAIQYYDAAKCQPKNEIFDSISLRCLPCEGSKGLVASQDGELQYYLYFVVFVVGFY